MLKKINYLLPVPSAAQRVATSDGRSGVGTTTGTRFSGYRYQICCEGGTEAHLLDLKERIEKTVKFQ